LRPQADTPGTNAPARRTLKGCQNFLLPLRFWHPFRVRSLPIRVPEVCAFASTSGYLLASLRLALITCSILGALIHTSTTSAADLTFFENKIRPLLADQCYSCHSVKAEKTKGGLHVDSLEALLKGGDSGPALVPGDAEKSLLIKAVRYGDPDLQMPPKGKKLSDRQIADLTQWIKAGAPWPETDKAAARPTKASHEITEKDRSWWAFQPIRRPQKSETVNSRSVISKGGKKSTGSLNTDPLTTDYSIDELVREQLAAKKLEPNPPATKRELIRRAYFDLIGLPPTPEQIATFEKDKSPDAWPRLIDELLARPQYGERWGRHWLDVARFAQSNGYERDGEKPESWRYRDYVVRAFNEDKPYDQFIREQIAGDELERVTFDSIIATGFHHLGVRDDEPDDKRMAEFDELDDMLSTTGSAFLGLTIGCARCHEHKFDPIPQADYYSLLSFFRNVRLYESPKYNLDSANYVPLADSAKLGEWRNARDARVKALEEKVAAAKDEAEKKKLNQQIEGVRGEKPPFEFALGVRERGAKPPPTHVLIRGNAGSPGAEVQPAFLSVLSRSRPEEAQTLNGRKDQSLLTSPPTSETSGRRRVFADWVASPENPLTARVMVNRIWRHHFGNGIVKTTSDFGRAGTPPTHPQLLDWLAADFIANGWSMKKLHRTIMLSQTYQMSSRAENAKANAVDPGNDLLWRQNLRRLEAEALRDTMLAISGRLNPKMGGRGFFPHLSGEVLAGQSRPGLDWELSSADEKSRRSLYAYVRRTMTVPMLDTFDYSNTTSPLSERPVTTVAPQALLLLNDSFMREQAAAFADRLEKECGGAPASSPALDSRALKAGEDAGAPPPHVGGYTEKFITRGFQLAVGREPTKRERQIARDFVERQEREFAGLRTRMTVRPDVPTSLSVSYMDKLKPEQFLLGPSNGWNYQRGRWSAPYESIRTVERDAGPFALAATPAFSNGMVTANLFLHTANESAGVLFRATTKDHEARGYEVTLEPREQRLSLRRLANEATVLAYAATDVPMARSVPLKIEFEGAHVRVWLGEGAQPVLDYTDPKPLLNPGQVGVRSWGAALSVDNLVLKPADTTTTIAIRDEQLAAPARRAREALCLLLLNLNEVVYVD
jgi:cytochrome c553